MTTEVVFTVEEAPEGAFVAKAANAAIFAEAECLADLRDQVRDAVTCHFEPGAVPKLIRLHFVRDEIIAV